MKRLMLITIIISISITASSCSAKAAANQDSTLETPKPVQTVEQMKPEESLKKVGIELAYEGKIDNLEFGIGDRLEKVIAEMGEPLELANFEGSSYVRYESLSFMLNKVIEKTSDEAAISGIIISEGNDIYGVKVGMTPNEIKSILGAASQEYKDGEGEEEMWKLEYQCGDYSLTFFFNDSSSPSTSAYLSGQQQ
jgi:hypothetical protein